MRARPEGNADSAFQFVDTLPVALEGSDTQTHLLAQLSTDESSHAVSLPPGGSQDGLECGSLRLLEQRHQYAP
jgi:hypothetical protein